jgi:hypothetical protein
VLQLVEKEVGRCVENNILSGLAGWELRKALSECKTEPGKVTDADQAEELIDNGLEGA